MVDDLRRRIHEGDLEALGDPSLPLYLLADGPTAAWWIEGSQRAWVKVLFELRSHVLRTLPYEAYVWHVDRITGLRLNEPMRVTVWRLRDLLPSVPPAVDAALEALEAYAPR